MWRFFTTTIISPAPLPSPRSWRDLHLLRLQSKLSSNGVTALKSPPAAGIDGDFMSLVVEGVSKRFGAVAALDNIAFDCAKGAFLALLGPSGSGKTTLLRILG